MISKSTITTSISSTSKNIQQHDVELCPYTLISLKLYLTLPVFKICSLSGVSNICSCLVVLTLYLYLVDYIFKFILQNDNLRSYITLVKHKPKPDHPHSNQITNDVIIKSLLLSFISLIGISFISHSVFEFSDTKHIDNNTTLVVENDSNNPLLLLGLYLVLLSFFHFSEYFVTSLTNPTTLDISSFLLDQSSAYKQAILCSVIEYLIEVYLFPNCKKINTISIVGLIMVISGELVRKCAMFTAGKSFSHLIKSSKEADHKLITHGIYSMLRHPSYAGWFYWAIGTQILLQNPICTIIFALISNFFFYERIKYEEKLLIQFFGNDYKNYMKKVKIWIPLWDSNALLHSIDKMVNNFNRFVNINGMNNLS